MPRVSTSRSRRFSSLSHAIAILQSARKAMSSRVASRTRVVSVMGLALLARAAELARDRIAPEPERLGGILPMAVLGCERGFEQDSLERRVRRCMDARFAVRERVLGPGAEAERPVGDRLARGAFEDAGRQVADRDLAARRQDRETLTEILQLAHVAGPGVITQRSERGRRETLRLH